MNNYKYIYVICEYGRRYKGNSDNVKIANGAVWITTPDMRMFIPSRLIHRIIETNKNWDITSEEYLKMEFSL